MIVVSPLGEEDAGLEVQVALAPVAQNVAGQRGREGRRRGHEPVRAETTVLTAEHLHTGRTRKAGQNTQASGPALMMTSGLGTFLRLLPPDGGYVVVN
jgi:hypothetical protein